MCAMVYLRFGWDLGVLCVIGLLALMNNDVYWIFLKNNKYIYTQKYTVLQGLAVQTQNYALRTTHSNTINSTKTLVRTIQQYKMIIP